MIGCGGAGNGGNHLDEQRLRSDALSLADIWINHAPLPNGFQQTRFDANWQPANGNDTVGLTAQARLIFVYVAAFDLSQEKRYLDNVRTAADFMLNHMQRPEEAGWYRSVDCQGDPVNRNVHTYGYSFAILALAHAYRITEDERYLKHALATWQSGVWPGLQAARQWRASGRLPVNEAKGFWSQNPFMHLFEALLALHETTGSSAVWRDVAAMAKFLEETLLQPCGCLPEWFEASSFSPQDGDDTRLYLGHQVELAFLLSRAVQQGLDDRYLKAANKLLRFAIRHGVDRETGGLQATSTMDGQQGNNSYWWWAQAELMRATVHFARDYGRHDLWPIYEKSHLFARRHFIDTRRGSWTNKSPYLNKKQGGKSRQVIGYHWMAFYTEALLPYARE